MLTDPLPGVGGFGDALTPLIFASRMKQCEESLDGLIWDLFDVQYDQLREFAEHCEEQTQLGAPWKQFRDSITARLKQRLETVSSFDDFQPAVARLSVVLSSPEALWSVLHKELAPKLKVTLTQARILAITCFTASQLFEFGFPGFSESPFCDMLNINNEEAIIDIFYAVVGFLTACGLPDTNPVRLPCYVDFTGRLLRHFMRIPDFDAHRFVWLVEMCHQHLCIESSVFLSLCESVIGDFFSSHDSHSLKTLHKLCVMSTSPFLRALVKLPQWIEQLYQKVISGQRDFLQKFIFSGFTICEWDLPDIRMSDPFEGWFLYITNFARKFGHKAELPKKLLATVLEDSLELFGGCYGEVQPTQASSAQFRLELFKVIDIVIHLYPDAICPTALHKCYFLLYIAAVSGATEDDLAACKPTKQRLNLGHPYLGLEILGHEFANYQKALTTLTTYFRSEFSHFPAMVSFVRAHYPKPHGESGA
jgi:hypothetical protein